MGWDCYAEPREKITGAIKEDFEKKSNELAKDFNIVDGLLQDGGLDVSDCEAILELMGFQTYSLSNAGIYEIKIRYESADFDNIKELTPDHAIWAIPSVKAFLEICIKHNLEISWSY